MKLGSKILPFLNNRTWSEGFGIIPTNLMSIPVFMTNYCKKILWINKGKIKRVSEQTFQRFVWVSEISQSLIMTILENRSFLEKNFYNIWTTLQSLLKNLSRYAKFNGSLSEARILPTGNPWKRLRSTFFEKKYLKWCVNAQKSVILPFVVPREFNGSGSTAMIVYICYRQNGEFCISEMPRLNWDSQLGI